MASSKYSVLVKCLPSDGITVTVANSRLANGGFRITFGPDHAGNAQDLAPLFHLIDTFSEETPSPLAALSDVLAAEMLKASDEEVKRLDEATKAARAHAETLRNLLGESALGKRKERPGASAGGDDGAAAAAGGSAQKAPRASTPPPPSVSEDADEDDPTAEGDEFAKKVIRMVLTMCSGKKVGGRKGKAFEEAHTLFIEACNTDEKKAAFMAKYSTQV